MKTMKMAICFAAILLTGCTFQERLAKIQKQCNADQTLPMFSQKVSCINNGEYGLLSPTFPDAMPDYMHLADKRFQMAKKVDSGEISPAEYNVYLKPDTDSFLYILNNYEALRLEAAKQGYCSSIGAAPGSTNYFACRRSLDMQIANEAAQRNAAALQYLGAVQQANAINNAGNNIANSINRPISTNCYRLGNNLNCQSY